MSKNKVALITGASSGIGKELAAIHASKKGDLVLVARRVEELNNLKKTLEDKYGVIVDVIEKDLSVVGAAKEVYDEVKSKNIEIDYLINNAGFGLLGVFHELPWETQAQMINLNMTALTQLMYLFLPDFVARNSGKILNNTSTASFMPGPLQAVYYASKSYAQSLSNAVAQELHKTNVSVTNLMPGATQSEFGKTSGMDKTSLFDKPATAKQVALAGYNGMIKGKLDVIAGVTFGQKIMFSLMPLIPKKMLLKEIYKLQNV